MGTTLHYGCITPYTVHKLLRVHRFPNFIYRKELVSVDDQGIEHATVLGSCYSSYSGAYIGNYRTASTLCNKFGLTMIQAVHPDHSVCSIGFNIKERKWYGWSHRAIYGFGIGSTVRKGDCGYTPATVDELFDEITTPDSDGFVWQNKEDVIKKDNGVVILHKNYNCIMHKDGSITVDKTHSSINEQFIPIGKGEWTAKTLAEAKQMACDFAEGVS